MMGRMEFVDAMITAVDAARVGGQDYYTVTVKIDDGEPQEFSTSKSLDFWEFFDAKRITEIQSSLCRECKFRYTSDTGKSIELSMDGRTLVLPPH